MKRNSTKSQPADAGDDFDGLSETERQFIKHILSPLELAAMRHNYQPFNYRMRGRFIYFSTYACQQLAEATRQRLSLVRNRINIEEKSAHVPRRLREVFEDPTQVMSLPGYVRRHLCRLECYNMLRMTLLGRQYFAGRPEFGKKSMHYIDALFASHKCSRLFK